MGFTKRTSAEAVEQDERNRNRDYAGLLDALEDPDPVARRWAARDLGQYPQADQPLLQHLQYESEVSVREAILASLVRLATPVAAAGLVALLRSEDAYLRNEAIGGLKLLPQQVAPLMEQMLSDPDPDVRIFAVNVLESLRHPQVEPWLLQVLARDAHVNVCATALDLLGEVGSAAAVPVLRALNERFAGEPYIQFSVQLALKRIEGSLA